MSTKTTDRCEVEHIEYTSDRTVDEVASALEAITGDLTDGRYEREVGSALATSLDRHDRPAAQSLMGRGCNPVELLWAAGRFAASR